MKLINNLSSANHLVEFNYHLSECDELLIVSPFLNRDFDEWFQKIVTTNINKISLITTLHNNDADILKKADSLFSFTNCCKAKSPSINCEISIDNQLHGKIYLFLDNGQAKKGIITSANFTDKGMKINHEWGVLIEDINQLNILIQQICSIDYSNLSEEDVKKLKRRADNYRNTKKKVPSSKIDLNINDLLSSKRKYFIKPLGSTKEPYPLNKPFDNSIINFSKTKHAPKVKPKDILICYAVGHPTLLGYAEIEAPPLYNVSYTRWPWYVRVRNLSRNFGSKWWNYDLYINDLVEDFLEAFPGQSVTQAGNTTLGALMYGKDRIELTESFAKYLMKKVDDNNI